MGPSRDERGAGAFGALPAEAGGTEAFFVAVAMSHTYPQRGGHVPRRDRAGGMMTPSDHPADKTILSRAALCGQTTHSRAEGLMALDARHVKLARRPQHGQP